MECKLKPFLYKRFNCEICETEQNQEIIWKEITTTLCISFFSRMAVHTNVYNYHKNYKHWTLSKNILTQHFLDSINEKNTLCKESCEDLFEVQLFNRFKAKGKCF